MADTMRWRDLVTAAVAACVALVVLAAVREWIGKFGFPLGGAGAHGGFEGSVRILVVPALGALVGAVLSLLQRGRVTVKPVAISAVLLSIAYFLSFDLSLAFGLIMRPLRLHWAVDLYIAMYGLPVWLLRAALLLISSVLTLLSLRANDSRLTSPAPEA